MKYQGRDVDARNAGIVVDERGQVFTHPLDAASPDRIAMAREEYQRAIYCALVRELALALEQDGAVRTAKPNDPEYMQESAISVTPSRIGGGCQPPSPR